MRRELARKKLISCAFSLPPRCPQAGIGEVPCIFPASREFGISETSSQLTLPSCRESVSRPHPRSRVETPAFRAGVRGWFGDAVGRDAQGFPIRANLRQYLCRAIFQYRSAADVVGENATPIPTKLGLPRFNVRQIFEFGSGSGKAEHGALIVPSERQT